MAAIPQRQNGTAQAIYDLHARRAAAESPRGYLGWSEIGTECDRALWYSWRWVGSRGFNGQLARLFDTGHREEARLLSELRALGYEVHDRDERGNQFGVLSHGGHFRGHCDAVVRGLPEAPKTWHLVDVKTIKSKKFDELLKKGMRAMYPKYWAQGQGYMGHLQLERAAFIFVCKDDERIHVERFEFERAEFEKYEARALRIIQATEPPLKLSEDPASFACKFCDFHAVCHGGEVPAVNCRTCLSSTPVMLGDTGAWSCERGCVHVRNPREAHECHRFIPPLLAAHGTPVDADDDSVTYEAAGGVKFVNGPAPGFSSVEIRTNPTALVDPTVQHIKATVSTAKVIG
jgi:hypothetical protein